MDETIPALFFRQAAARAGRPLFFVKRQGAYQPITWETAAQDVRALGGFLLAQGVNPGDRVLILSENRPEWGVADLAIQSVGAWSVPVYPTLTGQDVAGISEDAGPIAGIASTPAQIAKLLEAAGPRRLRTIVSMEPAPGPDAAVPWQEALLRGRALGREAPQALEARWQALRPEDTATLIYTSGTTGEPKGVMLSHRNVLSNVEACLRIMPITEADRHLSFLPLSHVFERVAGWYLMVAVGASVAYAETMETIPENMLEMRPTIMLGVPRFFEKLYARVQEGLERGSPLAHALARWTQRTGAALLACQEAGRRPPRGLRLQRRLAERLVVRRLRARFGGRLRFFIAGGAPLSKEIGQFFYAMGITILEGYGLTETSPVIAVNRLPVPRFGSVGPPIPGVEVRIAEDGEILTRGPHVMQGYYRKPEATAAVIMDGWFHTGDIGHLDGQGLLHITDRKKDLIKTAGGKFVAPQRLEGLLAADPYISQAFIYGDRQPYCVALVVPRMDRLREYARAQGLVADSVPALLQDPRVRGFYWGRVQARQQALASFEQVKRIALLDQEFSLTAGEVTPTLKARRSVIAERYAPILRALYASSTG